MDRTEEIRFRAEIRRLLDEIDRLKALKWEEQHTDTMDDMVALGIDRDSWKAQAEGLKAENERLRADRSSAEFDLCEHDWKWMKPDKMFPAPWQSCQKCGGASFKRAEQQDQES